LARLASASLTTSCSRMISSTVLRRWMARSGERRGL
jgi:hypothetical protein